ncbi:hypothetical protein ACHAWO_009272 [Cyclotella atomus]|uniref:Ion transport domain-containing protein n=1 Tax=Cyclotella atomus TaxID=382360 RepID=A0ABD3Q545_9STRA
MPAETRQITLSRSRQATIDRLSPDQRLFFIDSNKPRDEVPITQVDVEVGGDGVAEDNCGIGDEPMDAAPSPCKEGFQDIDTAMSNDENVQLGTNDHQSNLLMSPVQHDDTEGLQEIKSRKIPIAIRSLSDMSKPNIFDRKQIGCVVNDSRVQGFILALIVINAIMMGVATFPFVKDNQGVSAKFELIDEIFLIIFTIEAVMQLAYHGWTLFKDAWLVFDLTIVALSWALEGVKVARAFRIFRALRLIARIDVMKNLIIAVTSVIPNLTGIGMLLFLLFYIFAVMFTQLYKDISKQYPRQQQYFVGLPETFFTLFQMMTLYPQLEKQDGWKKVLAQAYDEYWWSWIFFIAFIVVTAFVFANLIIAVICDAVHVLGEDDVAGLIGFEEDEVTNAGRYRNSFELSRGFGSSTIDRLREMEAQLDQIVLMKDDLMVAMNALVKHSGNETHQARPFCVGEDAIQHYYEGHLLSSADFLLITDGDSGSESESVDHHQNGLSLSPCNGHLDSTPDQTEEYQKEQSKQTFPDVNERFVEMISHAKENLIISRLNDFRIHMGEFVNDSRVQRFILALIVINAIMMGVATFPFVKDNQGVSAKFELIDEIFLIIFTIEAVMQLAYHGWTLFKDAWLVFDLTIVALSWALEGVKVARAFRIFRALRLIARIDVMKNLIIAVTSVIPNLTGIGMLLFLLFYIFAVMFTQLYKDISKQYPRQQQYFVGLPETFFTLFQMMTLYPQLEKQDGWKKVLAQAYDEYWWSWILFVAFIVVTAFVFVNLIIAVICDAVHVMGDRGVAGLTGCDEDEITKIRSRDPLELSPRASNLVLWHKLREIERSIDEIVSIQNQMVMLMDKLARSG